MTNRVFYLQEGFFLKEKESLEKTILPKNAYIEELTGLKKHLYPIEVVHLLIVFKYIYKPKGTLSLITNITSLLGSRRVIDMSFSDITLYCVFSDNDDWVKFSDWLNKTNGNVLPSISESNISHVVPVQYEIYEITDTENISVMDRNRYLLNKNNLEDIDWLVNHCKYPWYWNNHFLFFEDDSDAMHFKLRWKQNKADTS